MRCKVVAWDVVPGTKIKLILGSLKVLKFDIIDREYSPSPYYYKKQIC
jgi:hypothetical protein